MGARDPKERLAAEVWQLMSNFSFSAFQNGSHVEILRELGLTPGHMKALAMLDPEQPKPMRAMADSLSCDASMVTWLVDRLEERGLVERKSLREDRRVKTVVLTPLGKRTRDRLLRSLRAAPRELMKLDRASLQALREQLEKLPAAGKPGWGAPKSPVRVQAAG